VKVLVDTSVWSLALRRRAHGLDAAQHRLVREVEELIRERRTCIIGPIRQELLSGIRDQAVFVRVRDSLRAFLDEPLSTKDFEEAARVGNLCRSAGISGSSTDFLICAVALARKLSVFTLDRDFERYVKQVPLVFHAPRPE